jgi:hypothetical protein
MQIRFTPTPIPATISLPKGTLEGSPLTQGQRLEATVLAKLEGQLALRLGDGSVVEARSTLPLEPGTRLQLVVELGKDQVLLRLLDPPPSGATLARALRTVLPHQGSLEPVLRLLTRLVADAGKALPEPVARATKEFLGALPTHHELTTSAGLQRAVRDSGLFTEARLAAGDANLSRDLKTQLHRLASALRSYAAAGTPRQAPSRTGPAPPRTPPPGTPAAPTPNTPTAERPVQTRAPAAPEAPPSDSKAAEGKRAAAQTRTAHGRAALDQQLGGDLLRRTEAALSRVQFHQLSSLPTRDRPDPMWLLEVPIRQEGEDPPLRLRIRREADARRAGEDPRWSVTLDFTTGDHGPVAIIVTVAGQSVSTTFWSERAETAALFNEQMEHLRERLEETGLSVSNLASQVGRPPAEAGNPSLPTDLLDVKA